MANKLFHTRLSVIMLIINLILSATNTIIAQTPKESDIQKHEGFCLFDTRFTDYKSTNTPYGKDFLKEWVMLSRPKV
jgi:hypothetical protein